MVTENELEKLRGTEALKNTVFEQGSADKGSALTVNLKNQIPFLETEGPVV